MPIPWVPAPIPKDQRRQRMSEAANMAATTGQDSAVADGAARRAAIGRAGIIVAIHLAGLALWQVLVVAFDVPTFVLPSPLATIATLAGPESGWASNTLVTAAELFGCFLMGLVAGVGFALLFSLSRALPLALLPPFVPLNI